MSVAFQSARLVSPPLASLYVWDALGAPAHPPRPSTGRSLREYPRPCPSSSARLPPHLIAPLDVPHEARDRGSSRLEGAVGEKGNVRFGSKRTRPRPAIGPQRTLSSALQAYLND